MFVVSICRVVPRAFVTTDDLHAPVDGEHEPADKECKLVDRKWSKQHYHRIYTGGLSLCAYISIFGGFMLVGVSVCCICIVTRSERIIVGSDDMVVDTWY